MGTVSQSVFLIASVPGLDTQTVYVFVTDTNGCTNSDTATVIFDICIGVEENLAADHSILYPSLIHSGNNIVIKTDNKKHNSVLFHDVNGKLVLRKEFDNEFEDRIDFPEGIYFYRILSDDRTIGSGKMIVQ